MSDLIKCEACQREWDVTRVPDGSVEAHGKGVPPAPCCMRSLTDGHAVLGKFIVEP